MSAFARRSAAHVVDSRGCRKRTTGMPWSMRCVLWTVTPCTRTPSACPKSLHTTDTRYPAPASARARKLCCTSAPPTIFNSAMPARIGHASGAAKQTLGGREEAAPAFSSGSAPEPNTGSAASGQLSADFRRCVLLIDPFERGGRDLDGRVGEDPLALASGDRLALVAGAADRVREAFRRARGDVLPLARQDPADVGILGARDRDAERHRLEHDVREALVLRGDVERVALAHDRRDVGAQPGELDAVLEPEAVVMLEHRGLVAARVGLGIRAVPAGRGEPVPHEQNPPRGVALDQPRRGREREVVVLRRLDRADQARELHAGVAEEAELVVKRRARAALDLV